MVGIAYSAIIVGATWYFLFNPHNFGIQSRARLDGTVGRILPVGRQFMITDLDYQMSEKVTFSRAKCAFIWLVSVGECVCMCERQQIQNVVSTCWWVTLCGAQVHFWANMPLHSVPDIHLHANFVRICICVSYLSILCSLLGVMPLPLSVNVRQRWPDSSTTSIQNWLAETPGSDALSRTREKEMIWKGNTWRFT